MNMIRIAYIDGAGAEYMSGICKGINKLPGSVKHMVMSTVSHNGHCQTIDAKRMVGIISDLGGEIRESHKLGTEYWLPRKVSPSAIKRLCRATA